MSTLRPLRTTARLSPGVSTLPASSAATPTAAALDDLLLVPVAVRHRGRDLVLAHQDGLVDQRRAPARRYSGCRGRCRRPGIGEARLLVTGTGARRAGSDHRRPRAPWRRPITRIEWSALPARARCRRSGRRRAAPGRHRAPADPRAARARSCPGRRSPGIVEGRDEGSRLLFERRVDQLGLVLAHPTIRTSAPGARAPPRLCSAAPARTCRRSPARPDPLPHGRPRARDCRSRPRPRPARARPRQSQHAVGRAPKLEGRSLLGLSSFRWTLRPSWRAARRNGPSGVCRINGRTRARPARSSPRVSSVISRLRSRSRAPNGWTAAHHLANWRPCRPFAAARYGPSDLEEMTQISTVAIMAPGDIQRRVRAQGERPAGRPVLPAAADGRARSPPRPGSRISATTPRWCALRTALLDPGAGAGGRIGEWTYALHATGGDLLSVDCNAGGTPRPRAGSARPVEAYGAQACRCRGSSARRPGSAPQARAFGAAGAAAPSSKSVPVAGDVGSQRAGRATHPRSRCATRRWTKGTTAVMAELKIAAERLGTARRSMPSWKSARPPVKPSDARERPGHGAQGASLDRRDGGDRQDLRGRGPFAAHLRGRGRGLCAGRRSTAGTQASPGARASAWPSFEQVIAELAASVQQLARRGANRARSAGSVACPLGHRGVVEGEAGNSPAGAAEGGLRSPRCRRRNSR